MAKEEKQRSSSVEAEAFREISGDLLDLVLQPDVLAWKLFSKKLITKEVRENACIETVPVSRRNMALMRDIEAQLSCKPEKLIILLTILQENEAFSLLYQKLNDVYQRLKKKNENKKSGNPAAIGIMENLFKKIKSALQLTDESDEKRQDVVKMLNKVLDKSFKSGADFEDLKLSIAQLYNGELLINEAEYIWALDRVEELYTEHSKTSPSSSQQPQAPAQKLQAQQSLFCKDTVYHGSLCCLTVNKCDAGNYHHFLNSQRNHHTFQSASLSRIPAKDPDEVDRYLIALQDKTYYVAFKGESNLLQWKDKFKSFEEGIMLQTNKIPLRFFVQQIIDGYRIVLTGFSFGGLLACSVAAKLCREPDLTAEQLQHSLVCITFGQPMISINVIQETAQQMPVFCAIVHCVLMSGDMLPFIMKFLDTAALNSDYITSQELHLNSPILSVALQDIAKLQEGNNSSQCLDQLRSVLLDMMTQSKLSSTNGDGASAGELSAVTYPGNIYKICNKELEWKEIVKGQVFHELPPLTEMDINSITADSFQKYSVDDYHISVIRGYLERSPVYASPPPCATPINELPLLKPSVSSVSFHHHGKEIAVVIEGDNLWFCHKIHVATIPTIKIEADKVSRRSIQFNYTPRDENEVPEGDIVHVRLHSHFTNPIRKSVAARKQVYRFTYRQEQLAKHTPSELIELAYMSALLEQHPFGSFRTFSNRFQVLRKFLEDIGSVVPLESLLYTIASADDDLVYPCCEILIASGMKLPPSSCVQSGLLRAVARLSVGQTFKRRSRRLFEIEETMLLDIAEHVTEDYSAIVSESALQNRINSDKRAIGVRNPKRKEKQQEYQRVIKHMQESKGDNLELEHLLLSGEALDIQYHSQAHVQLAYRGIFEMAKSVPLDHPNYDLIHSIMKLGLQLSLICTSDVVCGFNIDLLYPVMSNPTEASVQPLLNILVQGRKALKLLTEQSVAPNLEGKSISELYNSKMLEIINHIRQNDLKLCTHLLGSFMEQQMRVPFKKSKSLFNTAETIASVVATAAIGVWALFSLNFESLNQLLISIPSRQLLVQVKDYIKGIFKENTKNIDGNYAGKLQFMVQGLDETVSCNSHYISYSLERQLVVLCENLNITASTSTDYLVSHWNELFKDNVLCVVASSYRPLVARWMRWALMVHNLREELAKYTAVGVVGLVNSGKSKLVHNLFKIQVAIGTTECKRTTVPFLYNLDDVVEGLDVIDFPGVDDRDKTIPDLAELLLSLAQVVVFVVDYRRVHTESAKHWLNLLDNRSVQILVCLTHADKLYVEYMDDDGSHPPRDVARRKIEEQLKMVTEKLELSPKCTIQYYSFCQDKDSTLNTDEGRKILRDVGIGSSQDVGDWLVRVLREHMDQQELSERLHKYIYEAATDVED